MIHREKEIDDKGEKGYPRKKILKKVIGDGNQNICTKIG